MSFGRLLGLLGTLEDLQGATSMQNHINTNTGAET
jgi:hypothetical protein